MLDDRTMPRLRRPPRIRRDGGAGSRRRRSPELVHLALAPVLTLLGACVPLLFNREFYFYADTPEGAYGQWYELGSQLLDGQWPLMNPAAWMAGNYAAEGQWGLWNPLILLIALFVRAVPDALIASTVVKLLFIAIAATGVYLLTRDLGASRGWALVAGVAAPLGGFTLYMDATSWVTNLEVWALFPWVVWGVRRFVERRGSVLWPAVCGYLLITVGYVQGTIMLVLLYVSLLVVTAVRRQGRAVLRTLAVGVIHGLVALAVFLPGVLTSDVTSRADEIRNDGFMVLTLSGLATGLSGFSTGDLSGWWGRFTDLPLLYIAWFLPLALLVSGPRLRALAPRMMGLWIFGLLVVVLAVGPSEMGPLRFPSRSIPWITLVAVISTAVLVDRGVRRRPRAGVLVAMLLSVAVSAWFVFAADPGRWHWPRNGVHIALGCLGLLAVWFISRQATPASRDAIAARQPWSAGRVVRIAPVVVLIITLGVSALQAKTFAPLVISRSDYPAQTAVYEDAVPEARGDAVVVGDALSLPSDFWGETVFGNSWYLASDANFQNLYTPVGFQAYAQDYCMLFDGRTCPELATKLFERDPTTDQVLADLLSLDTVQILVDDEHPIHRLEAMDPPEGWSRTDVTDQSVTWSRDRPTPDAGGAVWASVGTDITQGAESNLSSTVHIDAVGPEGGTIVFSRLDWPGYTVDGATKESPLRGYLLKVEVPPGAAGTDVTVTFRPPAWHLVVGSMVLAGVLTVLIAGAQQLSTVRARRRGSDEVVAAGGPPEG